jgi:hypothetical protein
MPRTHRRPELLDFIQYQVCRQAGRRVNVNASRSGLTEALGKQCAYGVVFPGRRFLGYIKESNEVGRRFVLDHSPSIQTQTTS